MILVVDASFAAKVVLTEQYSDVVRDWWADDSVAWWAPTLIGPEVESAISIHQRNHAETVDIARRKLASVQWANMLDGIASHTLTGEVGDAAIGVVQDHGPVRGADACYVAVALNLAAQAETDVVLGSFDKQQRAAAVSAGLPVVPA